MKILVEGFSSEKDVCELYPMVHKNVSVSRLSEDGSIVCVAINRPSKLNAVNAETLVELDSVFSSVLKPEISNIKCVILRGSGERAFSSGLDLSCESTVSILQSSSKMPSERAEELGEVIKKFQRPILSISKFPRPIICSIEGVCYGLGVDLASACDIRVASDSSVFSVREVKIGICADLGSLYFLPRICRNDSWVREVCLTGREFSCSEAFSNGFVSHLVSKGTAFQKSLEIALCIAQNQIVAVQGTKRNLNFGSRKGMKAAFNEVALWNSIKMQDIESIGRALGSSNRSKL